LTAYNAILASLLLTVCASAETVANPSKRKGAGPLFRISRGEKWGYMDRTGKTVISPQFDSARDFFHGLAAVLIGKKWGYVDEKGKLAIPAAFDDVRDFIDDLAPVRMSRKWGYIDTTGHMRIEPRFQAAAEFHEGLARVHLWNKIVGNKEYSSADAPEYMFRLPEDDPSDVRGHFVVGGHFGFIDKTGSLVIPATFFIAQDFSDGLAAVRVEETATSKFGYIDVSGKFAIAPRFGQAAPFSEGLASVEVSARVVGNHVENIAYGFIDKTGQLAIPAAYQFAGSFSEGLARVAISLGSSEGFIDRHGQMVIEPRFIRAQDFSDGLAVVCANPCTYIDQQGRETIENLQAAWQFVDGLAVTGYFGPQTYIDKTGRKIAPYIQ
jgi:hypothetical protein